MHLQLKCLWDHEISTYDNEIRKQLSSLPEGLDEIYINCLRRISTKTQSRSTEIARKVFRWVAYAQRPLTAEELQELVSIDGYQFPLTKDMMISLPAIEYCANLVVRNPASGCIEFTHVTVRDLLLSDKLHSESIESYLDVSIYSLSELDYDLCSYLCLHFLQYQVSRTTIVQSTRKEISTQVSKPIIKSVSEALLPQHFSRMFNRKCSSGPVLTLSSMSTPSKRAPPMDMVSGHYVTSSWLDHCRNATLETSMMNLFDGLCARHNETYQPWRNATSKGRDHKRQMLIHAVMENHEHLYFAARRGLRSNLKSILQSNAPGTDSTLLHIAISLNNYGVARHMIPDCNLTAVDGKGQSALIFAIENHRNNFVDRLLKEKYAIYDNDEAPLFAAGQSGNMYVAVQIIENYQIARSGYVFSDLRAAFWAACLRKDEELAWYLVCKGVRSDCPLRL